MNLNLDINNGQTDKPQVLPISQVPKSDLLLNESYRPKFGDPTWSWLSEILTSGSERSLERKTKLKYNYYVRKEELLNFLKDLLYTDFLRQLSFDYIDDYYPNHKLNSTWMDSYLSQKEFLNLKKLLQDNPHLLYFRASAHNIIGPYFATQALSQINQDTIERIDRELQEFIEIEANQILEQISQNTLRDYGYPERFSVIPTHDLEDNKLINIQTSIPFVGERHGVPIGYERRYEELPFSIRLDTITKSEKISDAVSRVLTDSGYSEPTLGINEDIHSYMNRSSSSRDDFILNNASKLREIFPLKLEVKEDLLVFLSVGTRENIAPKIQVQIEPLNPVNLIIDFDNNTGKITARFNSEDGLSTKVPCKVRFKLDFDYVLDEEKAKLMEHLLPSDIIQAFDYAERIIPG